MKESSSDKSSYIPHLSDLEKQHPMFDCPIVRAARVNTIKCKIAPIIIKNRMNVRDVQRGI